MLLYSTDTLICTASNDKLTMILLVSTIVKATCLHAIRAAAAICFATLHRLPLLLESASDYKVARCSTQLECLTCILLEFTTPLLQVYERAIANIPPAPEKRYWQRYIYLWINYALFEELQAQDMERTREVYRACLKLIPHKAFTFAKVQPYFVSQGICAITVPCL